MSLLSNISRRLSYLYHCVTPYSVNHKNKLYDRDAAPNRPIYVFYHIFCGVNDYKSIVKDQVGEMTASGLMDQAERLYIVIIGDKVQRDEVKSFFPQDKLHIVLETTDGSCFEFPLLQCMQKLAEKEKFYALYIHTKGASLSKQNYLNGKIRKEYGKYESIVRNVNSWRQLMEYFCISKWPMAINALNDGYLYYGCLLKTIQPCWQVTPHYSGNFWWVLSEATLQTDRLTEANTKDRYFAEFWIVRDTNKAYNTVHCPLVLYATNFRQSLYTKQWYHIDNILYSINHVFRLPVYMINRVYCL